MVNKNQITMRSVVAVRTARSAGRLLADRFGCIKKIKSKGDRDLVTDIDLAAEAVIKNEIIRNFPEDNIISEENSLKRSGEFSWIIDPLDGTHNYIHNINIFGVSVAVAYKNEIIIGVNYIPQEKGLYFAQKKNGAYLNGRRIHVSQRKMKQATLIFDSSLRYQKPKMLRGLDRLVDEVFNVRMFGSTVRGLTYVAAGKAEVEVEYNDKLWDFAAGLLLIEEAGGKVTDLSGRKWDINTKGYIASNSKIHNKVLALIK